MITKWATSIANKLAELSGEDVSADQLEIYIYGRMFFEYFYNHSVIVRMGSFITYTRLYPNLGNYLFIVTTLYRRCPCSNAVNMYLRQLFSRLS